MSNGIKLATVVVAALAAMPVLAQNVQNPDKELYRLIDNSDGYFNIRDNVVMIEGEYDIKACRFGLTPEFFAAYGAGDAAGIDANKPQVVCASLTEFKVADAAAELNDTGKLYEFIDNSEAYVNVAQNVVMIEGESDIEFCHFDLSDDYFAAVLVKDDAAMTANQPVVTCVPFADLRK